ncbi:MAG TPA: VIT1/CCC1 family protein [Bacteroidales bacterium]|nr:VIT1/CCC1 family protein [Bacteroidales bacterium]HPO66165.1 VIT1/CCC1 family protein [Bacteroidales bacterium]
MNQSKPVAAETLKLIKKFQENEITEYHIYNRLAAIEKNAENKAILEKIAREEKAHYEFWKRYTGEEIAPVSSRVWWYFWIVRLFGLTFGIKLMEKGETKAQDNYSKVLSEVPEVQTLIDEENEHENRLINLIQEEKLNYIGSIVLGLNDALVELTGALAGLSFALQDTRVIAFAGFITGIAAALSMAAAEFLSQRHEGAEAPIRSALYTGSTYMITVILLILPYLLFSHYLVCLVSTIIIALLIILIFNYYISVAKDLPFRKRFAEMAIISLSVSLITFAFSVLVKTYFNIEI